MQCTCSIPRGHSVQRESGVTGEESNSQASLQTLWRQERLRFSGTWCFLIATRRRSLLSSAVELLRCPAFGLPVLCTCWEARNARNILQRCRLNDNCQHVQIKENWEQQGYTIGNTITPGNTPCRVYEIHLVVKGESTIKQSIKLTVDFYNKIKHSSEVCG